MAACDGELEGAEPLGGVVAACLVHPVAATARSTATASPLRQREPQAIADLISSNEVGQQYRWFKPHI
jgi:hypothetical protein